MKFVKSCRLFYLMLLPWLGIIIIIAWASFFQKELEIPNNYQIFVSRTIFSNNGKQFFYISTENFTCKLHLSGVKPVFVSTNRVVPRCGINIGKVRPGPTWECVGGKSRWVKAKADSIED